MSQSARLRNFSPRERLSTAMICVSPRAFGAFAGLDPMNPAAPVTTMYTYDSGSELDIEPAELRDNEGNARSDRAQQFVADRACRRGNVVDGQPGTPQHDGTAHSRLGHIRQVDGHEIHRHAT